jgi:hypothetical protein
LAISQRLYAVAVAIVLVAGCGAPPSASPTTDRSSSSASGSVAPPTTSVPSSTTPPTPSPTPEPLSRDEAARADLSHLAEAMEQTHADLFHDMTRSEWQAAVERLHERIPDLTDEQLTVEFMRLAALPSYRGGRDGHMAAFPIDDTSPPAYPVSLYVFADGVYVTRALPPHENLVGARIVSVAGHPIDDVRAAIDPLLPRDNPHTPENFLPRFLIMPEVLSGLGLLERPGPVEIEAERPGRRLTARLGPVAWQTYLDQLGDTLFHLPPRPGARWTSRAEETFWWTRYPGTRTVFAQYNRVGTPGLAQLNGMLEASRDPSTRRVVLDLRYNGGGNNRTYHGLRDGLADPAIDRPGRLFVITSTFTFSAAGNLATELDRETGARFVGEPMGGGLNQYGEGAAVYLNRLPVPLFVPVSTLYWEFAPGDDRLTIEPDIPAPMTGVDYFAGRDRALEAILAQG